jgi:hypothetical protein
MTVRPIRQSNTSKDYQTEQIGNLGTNTSQLLARINQTELDIESINKNLEGADNTINDENLNIKLMFSFLIVDFLLFLAVMIAIIILIFRYFFSFFVLSMGCSFF